MSSSTSKQSPKEEAEIDRMIKKLGPKEREKVIPLDGSDPHFRRMKKGTRDAYQTFQNTLISVGFGGGHAVRRNRKGRLALDIPQTMMNYRVRLTELSVAYEALLAAYRAEVKS